MRTALVVGGDGLIGHALSCDLKASGISVVTTSRKINAPEIQLDISKPFEVALLPRCDVVYLCAAISRFVACEQNPPLARLVNFTSQVKLAKHFFSQGTHVVFLSSNAVFNGVHDAPAEDASTCPVSIYGKLKSDAEDELSLLAKQCFGTLSIIRLTKVLSKKVPLIDKWLSSIKMNEKIEAFSNVTLSPVSLNYTIEFLRRCGEFKYNGIAHLSGEVELTYCELAKALAERSGGDSNLIQALGNEILSNQSLTHNRLSMIQTEKVLNFAPQSLVDFLDDIFI